MTTNTVTTYLKYAELQMAAEALFGLQGQTPGTTFSGPILSSDLSAGNNRASKFTEVQAQQFSKDWVVVEHKSDTTTGFSGTLFKCLIDDPSRGLVKDQLVMSFRSTEFADDAARDNQATNAMEIKPYGWAFGQIDDMRTWVDGLYASGKIPAGAPLNVTGYSLGGHLATAFNLLYPGAVAATYTFNGAGVGSVNAGGGLLSVVNDFHQTRTQGAAGQFTTSLAQQKYAALRGTLNSVSADDSNGDILFNRIVDAQADLITARNGANQNDATLLAELQLLIDALSRQRDVLGEARRVATVTNGDKPAVAISAANIEATHLDYQLAVLQAGRATGPFRSSVAAGGWDAYAGRNPAPGHAIANFYDVYGANSPSAVSNSQYHYGTPTPVFIEDQPLSRGSVVLDIAVESLRNAEAKLLVNDFSLNDFGDTHSLVLLVDSLNVQQTLAALDPQVEQSTLDAILRNASAAKASTTIGTQGKAEGDVMENTIDALRVIMLGPSAAKTPANMQGGTWADIASRNTFYANLNALTDSAAFKAVAGKVTVGVSGKDLGGTARQDFASLLALVNLSPMALRAKAGNEVAVENALKAASPDLYAQWSADKALNGEFAGKGNFTDNWIADRATLISAVAQKNQRNIDTGLILDPTAGADRTYEIQHYGAPPLPGETQPRLEILIVDNRPGQLRPHQFIAFGDGSDNRLDGTNYQLGDHLYGGAGNDIVNGAAGADHLEGNADADQLDGGAGNDTLLGGSGDDTLTGGADDQAADTLQGGTGVDTYRFSGHWGKETIEDSDGQGLIEVDGQVLQAGLKQSDGVYRSADGNITYTEMAGADGAVDLLVSFKDKSDIITVRNWRTQAAPGNNLGIGLNEAQPPAPPAPLIGDYAKLTNGNTYTLDPHGYASTGPQAGAQDILVAGDDGANLSGLGGNDALQGGDGDDSLVGGEGDDLLLGGYGRDTLIGGAGNDFIFGSAMGSVQRPTNVNFTPPQVASGATEVARGFSWVAGRTNGQRWSQDGNDATFLDVEITGADVSTGFLGADGQIYVESLGNVIDAGAGDDFVDAGQGADVVHAGDGDDDVYGMGGADVLFGDAGSDFIMGDGVATAGQGNTTPDTLHGGDIIVGGAGRDVLLGQGGDDALYGGTEGDMLWGDDPDIVDTPLTIHGNDLLDGGDGDDRLEGGGRNDDLTGGAGADRLWGDGSNANAVAAAYQGKDTLNGGSGNDQLTGGGDDDDLYGGADNDVMWGDDAQSITPLANQGRDYLDGEEGDDSLVGGGNDDELFGGDGKDYLLGDDDVSRVAASGHGKDYLDGEAGDDELVGDGGDDTLFGGSDNDRLVGDDDISRLNASAHGKDFLDGESGNDTLFGAGDDDVLFGGEGNDFLSGDDASSPTDTSTLAGKDTLDGGEGDDTLLGGNGDDSLDGGNGNDQIFGGEGADTLTGGLGADYLDGGAGDDTYVLSAADIAGVNGLADNIADTQGRNIIQLGVTGQSASAQAWGTDGGVAIVLDPQHAVFVQGGLTGSMSAVDFTDGSVSMDRLIGSTYAAQVTRSVSVAGGKAFGGIAADVLGVDASASDATVSGGFGNDAITLWTKAGAQMLFSLGDGVDYVKANYELGTGLRTADNVLALGASLTLGDVSLARTDTNLYSLRVGAAGDSIAFKMNDADVAGAVSRPFDRLVFADGSQVTWQQLVDRGIEVIVPYGTGIAVTGTDRGDHIQGNAGSRTIDGGSGSDTLVSGSGNETLIGGAGDDAYVFTAGFGFDRVDNSTAAVSEVNTISFAAPLSFVDAVLTRATDDLIIRFTSTGDSVQIARFFSNIGSEVVQFADGTSFDRASIPAYGTSLQDLATTGNNNVSLTTGDDFFDALAGDDIVNGDSGNDTLLGNAGNDTLRGGLGNDVLDGGQGSNSLYGEDGNDTIYATSSDVVDGGNGDDRLVGGYSLNGAAGNDTFDSANASIYLGTGNDTVLMRNGPRGTVTVYGTIGAGEAKTIRFTEGVPSSSIVFTRSANDLTMSYPGDHSITLAGFYSQPANGHGYRVEFVDEPAITWSHDQLIAKANTATSKSDYLEGTSGSDTINGLDGADTIYGYDGDDVLDAGSNTTGGYDSVYGGNGNDTITAQFAYGGAGNDELTGFVMSGDGGLDTYNLFGIPGADYTITAGTDGGDVVIIGGALTPEDIRVGRWDATTMQLLVLNAAGLVTARALLQGQIAGAGAASPIAQVRFASQPGVVWTAADLLQKMMTGSAHADSLTGLSDAVNYLAGNGGDDTLVGGALADTLDGGNGTDLLSGGAGNDVYLFGYGSGVDRISDLDATGANLLQLRPGISPADLILYRTGQESGGAMRPNDSLVVMLASTKEQVWIDQFFQPGGNGTLSGIRFDDGTMLSYADIVTLAGTTLTGGANAATVTAGDDSYVVDSSLDTIPEAANGGIDSVLSSVSFILPAQVENIELTGDLALNATGNTLSNIIRGNSANNVLSGGGAGTDQFYGGAGDDTYKLIRTDSTGFSYASDLFNPLKPLIFENAAEGYDVLYSNEFAVTLPDNVETLIIPELKYIYRFDYYPTDVLQYTYIGNSLNNLIDLSSPGANFGFWDEIPVRIDGGAGADTMLGTVNDDTYVVDNADDLVIETTPYNPSLMQSLHDTIETSISYALTYNIENITLVGTAAIAATGNALDNVLKGAGNAASNMLVGLSGNDSYEVGLNDTVVEATNDGNDTVYVSNLTGLADATLDLAAWQNVENLRVLSIGGDLNLKGTASNNHLTGTFGSNHIEGLDGDDYLNGLAPGEIVWDSYYHHYNYPNSGNYVDTLDGGAGNDTLRALGGGATLLGGAGDDALELQDVGYGLADGGAGNDTYQFWSYWNEGSESVDVAFGSGAGRDEVITSSTRGAGSWEANHVIASSIKLSAPTDATALRFVRDGDALVVSLYGSTDSLRIDDYFEPGGNGVISALDSITLAGGTIIDRDAIARGLNKVSLQLPTSGNDLIFASSGGGTALGGDGSDDVVGQSSSDSLDGGAGDDRLYGGDGADQLVGGAGDDLLVGGHGQDTYAFSTGWGHDVVDEMQRTVTRNYAVPVEDDDAQDEVCFDASVNRANIQVRMVGSDLRLTDKSTGDSVLVQRYSLEDSTIETVRFQDGTVWTRSEIADLASSVIGTPGDDYLSAMSTASKVYGLEGNDTLQGGPAVDNLYGGAGDDYLQGQGFDILDGGDGNDYLSSDSAGAAFVGGAGSDTLEGSNAAETLDGGADADSMYGAGGDDTYIVDDVGDIVVEDASSGRDVVEASVSRVLETNVEDLTLSGTASINATGNASANKLTGNSGSNRLDGKAGSDTMQGGAGDDVYVVDSASDVLIEDASGGIDGVETLLTYSLASLANVENLTLTGSSGVNATGNASNNVLVGNSGANRIDGAGGIDTMSGGAGNDTYVVDTASDVINELAGEGIDSVESGVTLTLGAELEKLTLTGTSGNSATGNALANTLIGNSGANRLDGRAGADSMTGGAGNDTYVVDDAGDVATEAANGGTDTIESSITWTLGTQLENLTLIGTAAINATGNTLANTLRGNTGDNVLSGGSGNDSMLGGAGNDTYVVDVSTDVITENAGEGTDLVQSVVTWTLGSNLENLTLTGSGTSSGTGNTVANVLTGNSANNTLTGLGGNDTLDGGGGNDTMVGGTGDDTYLVNVSTDVVTENASEGTDTIQSAVTLTLGNNVENLTLTGSNAINATGNTLANTLLGNSGANVLTGAAGDDIYDGGTGNDTFTDSVTTSNDTYLWGIGSGLDTLTDAGGSLDHIDLYAGIAKSQLKFVKNANDLELSVLGQTDKLTIKNWYVGTANQIEEFRLSDGSKVLASEVNGLLSAMAAFVPMDSSTGQAKTGFIDMPISNPQMPPQAWM